MGSPVTATLAYGYDLGNLDDFRADKRDEYGGPASAWYDDEGAEFAVQLFDALYAASGLPAEANADDRQAAAERFFGVAFCGTDAYQGWVLIAVGSEREACNADTMALDVRELLEGPDLWDAKLAAALTALGITPTQDGPAWLVFPSLG